MRPRAFLDSLLLAARNARLPLRLDELREENNYVLPLDILYPHDSDCPQPSRKSVRISAALVVSLLLAPLLLPLLFQNRHFILHHIHAVAESFCALVAFLVAGTALGIYLLRPRIESLLFVMSFFSMGIFDLVHALSIPSSNEFVLLHSLTPLWGGTLMFLASAASGLPDRFKKIPHRPLVGWLLLLLSASVLWPLLATGHLPTMAISEGKGNGFTLISNMLNGVGGMGYALAALFYFRAFARKRDFSLLTFSAILALFAESAFLFPLSTLWDLTWWLWHGIKVFLYVTILGLLVLCYILATRGAIKAKAILASANRLLEQQRQTLEQQNQILSGRNIITESAARTLDIPQILSAVEMAIGKCGAKGSVKLLLNTEKLLNPDLTGYELRTGDQRTVFARFTSCNNDEVRHQCVCNAPTCATDKESAKTLCFPLLAHGDLIGRLAIRADPELPNAQLPLEQIRLMLEATGPALDSAILYRETAWASTFQDSLRTMLSMINSSLDVHDILSVVCTESANLMRADSTAIWLFDVENRRFTRSASYCVTGGNGDCNIDYWRLELPLRGIPAIEQVVDSGDSLALDSSHSTEIEGLFSVPQVPWATLGIIPITGRTDLLGLMALSRSSSIPFSTDTLDRAYLLAQHAGVALQNALLVDELKRINTTLRERHLENVRSQKLAILGRMAATVAHELRNPLGAMSNCVQVLKNQSVSTGLHRRAFAILEKEVERLRKLAGDYLTFAVPAEVQFTPTDIVELLDNLTERMGNHVNNERRDITIELDYPRYFPRCHIDSDRLEQVLWNLFINSVHAIEKSGTIWCGARIESGKFRLYVKDTGCGISKDQIHQIFEPFYTTRASGAGLGLVIAKQIVDDHNGTIEVDSTVMHGTTVTIVLPLREEEEYSHATSA